MPISVNGEYTSPSLEGFSELKQLFNSNEMIRLEHANKLYSSDYVTQKWYSHFCRFGYLSPQLSVVGGREYLFFTKPDLHLLNPRTNQLNPELKSFNFFQDCYDRYNKEMRQWQSSVNRSSTTDTSKGTNTNVDASSPFMNLLTNTVSGSLELPGIAAVAHAESNMNLDGNKIFYRKTSYPSDHDHEFSLEFTDTRDLNVYMMFKMYEEYQRLKADGHVTPPDVGYTLQRVLHDQFSIYKFIVDADGYSLMFWAKLTGVFPTGVPRDIFSDMSNNSNGLKLVVPFKATYIEDMDPIILGEFNSLVKNVVPKNPMMNMYDPEIGAVNGEWPSIPYITRDKGSITKYNLRWR